MRKWIIGMGLLVLGSITNFGMQAKEKDFQAYNTIHVVKQQVLQRDTRTSKTIQEIHKAIYELGDKNQENDEASIWIEEYDDRTTIRVNQSHKTLSDRVIDVLEKEMGLEDLKENLEEGYKSQEGNWEKEIEEYMKEESYRYYDEQMMTYYDKQVIVYFGENTQGKYFEVQLPHQEVRVEQYKELHEQIRGEGYVVSDIKIDGKNDLLVYKDIPSRVRSEYIYDGTQMDHSGLCIEIEIDNEEIVRVSGIINDQLRVGEEIKLEYYQQQMLMRVLESWNISTNDQEQIWDTILSDIINKDKANKEETANYTYKSQTIIDQYGVEEEEYLMKFDITK